MESWEVLYRAIPRQATKRVAQLLNVGPNYVGKWRREPESEDAPEATGQRSILDRICELIDAVFLVNPSGVGLIVNYINAHHRRLLQRHAQPLGTMESRVDCTNDLLKQATQAICNMNADGCTPDTLAELIQLREVTDLAIHHCESTIATGIF